MRVTFNELRAKEVVNTSDGRRMGRVTDLVFDYPEYCVLGITVPGDKCGLLKCRNEDFIPVSKIVKIGEDVVLIKGDEPKKEERRNPRPRDCFESE